MNCRSGRWLLFLLLLLPSVGWAQAALSDKYRQKAETLYDSGNYEAATIWYENAYKLVRRIDPVRAANLCVDLGSMDYMKTHTRKATDRCLLGLRHIKSLKTSPDSVRFKLFSSLGTFYKALYRKDSALFYFRKADALLTYNPHIEEEIPIYVLYHFNNQGSWFFKMGNYSRSLSYLDQARKVAEKHSGQEELADIESNLAGCYEAMGNFSEALVHTLRADKLYPNEDIQKCHYISGIAWVLYKLQRYPESLSYFTKSERLITTLRKGKRAYDYTLDQVMLWRMMGSCYRAANQRSASDRYITKALRLCRQHSGGQGSLLAQVLMEKGKLHEARYELTPAVNSYQAAIRAVCRDTLGLATIWRNPSFETASDEATLLAAASCKAAALKKQYDATRKRPYLDASITAYRFCVKLQQRIRHGIDTDQSQVIFSDHQHALVPDAIAATFEAYQHQRSTLLRETLFQLFEQAQAASLREAFRLNTIKLQTIPGPLLEREQRLKKRISDLKKRSVIDTAATTELTSSQLQWHQLVETFRQDYPAYYKLNYQDVEISSQTLQQHLGDQAAYIAYVRRSDSLFILVVTNQAINIICQPINSTRFDGQLARLNQELYQDPVLVRYNGATFSAELYATCIQPIRKHITGRTRLVISRDWSFNFLPFEVLETGKQSRDYLARQVAISYAFSAQSFFAIPQKPVSTKPVLVIAPFARPEALESTVNRQNVVKTLGSSEAEARTIGGDVLDGPKASLSHFLKTNLNRPVIYFATHAKTDDTDPANSYIAFYPGETDKLYSDDIYNLQLTSTGLAVLGACETGSGQNRKGEGVMSMARAFAYAGCQSVVTTLWKANDETTSFLTVRLHEHLSQGMAIDQALQQARLDFFKSPIFHKYDHPYYWANYTLLGNYNPVMSDGGRSLMHRWLLFALAISLLAFWQRKRLIPFIETKKLST